jgi:putative MFS transporter
MISSLTVPRLSDRYYGRKRPYVISLTLQTIFHIIILFSHNIWLNIILFFLVGCCAGGRVCVGLSYLNEFVPERYQNITSVMFTNMDALVMTYQGLFYLYVPDWYYVHGVAILAAIVLLACAFQFPESPKYMYANHRYGETRQILKIIAGKNGAAVTNDEIDNFLFEFEGIEYMSLLV